VFRKDVLPLASKRAWLSGLDVTDVTTLMHQVEDYHKVKLSLVLSLDGGFAPYRMEVICVATRTGVTSTGRKPSVSRKRFFPTYEAMTLEGLLFRLVNEIDTDCGAMWSQETLPL